MKQTGILMMPEMENKPYCTQCGEESNLSYITQYACGDHYKCEECGHEICHKNNEEHQQLLSTTGKPDNI